MTGNGGPERDRPVGELLRELSDETTTLVRHEIRLAKAELAQKGRRAGIGAGMFGGAGVLGLLAAGALTACIIAALDEAMPLWLAALIPAVVYGIAAALLARSGKHKVDEAGPPIPQESIESVKEDVQWAKTRAGSSRT